MRAELILDRLEKVKQNGTNKWLACCPAHDDRSPSLSVFEAPDGRVLIHCFAGCGGADVMESIGLTLSDLYPDGALNDHLTWVGNQKKKHDSAPANVLKLAKEMRKNGQRLTPKDLEQERQAFMNMRARN